MDTTIETKLLHTAWRGVRAQGGPSLLGPSALDGSSMCAYRGSRGRKCALGWIITDDEYTPKMEGHGVVSLDIAGLLPNRLKPFVQLLEALQAAHDALPSDQSAHDALPSDPGFNRALADRRFAEVASRFGLPVIEECSND